MLTVIKAAVGLQYQKRCEQVKLRFQEATLHRNFALSPLIIATSPFYVVFV